VLTQLIFDFSMPSDGSLTLEQEREIEVKFVPLHRTQEFGNSRKEEGA
jgi:hypothetical protein